MKAKITIIIPIYNVEKYIRECLNSIEKQSYKNFIVMAVDDGSPDNSKNIVQEFVERDSRFTLVEKENGGYGSVLEYGIKNIKTKYFLICDPDDWLEKDALEKLYNFAEKKKLDITVGDKYHVYLGRNMNKEYVKCVPKDLKIEPKRVYTKNIQYFAFSEVSPHAKLFRTAISKEISFPHKISYTDTILYIMSLANAKRVAYYNEALADYLIDRPGNTMTNVRESRLSNTIRVWDSLYDQLSHKNNVDVLWSFMYQEIRLILQLFKNVKIKTDNKLKYKKNIYKRILLLQKHRSNIDNCIFKSKNKLKSYSIIEQFFYFGFIHRITYKLFAEIYIKIKG